MRSHLLEVLENFFLLLRRREAQGLVHLSLVSAGASVSEVRAKLQQLARATYMRMQIVQ
jgi:hypothetical protein